MAKILEKDPATYSKERDGFLRDLQTFHETRGTPFKRPPTIGGKEIDLYLLYTLVTAQGGWLKVNSKNNWSELLQHFLLPSKCVNGSVVLKQLYLRYLDRYEKVHFLGEEADRGSDDDEESRHKRWSARALHSVPLTYNYHVHNVNEANRDYNHLSTNLYKASDYDRLALSLISPLPNEQDFAINVCTLLSNDGKHTLKLEKHPRIINFLLGHAGVYNHSSLRKLFIHNYNVVRKQPIHSFWHDVVDSGDLLEFVNEDDEKEADKLCLTNTPKDESKASCSRLEPVAMDTDDANIPNGGAFCTAGAGSSSTESDNDSESELFNLGPSSEKSKRVKRRPLEMKIEPGDDEMFCVGRTLGTQDYLGQRVLQVATILRNLSFIDDNVTILSSNKSFIKFVLLCANARWNYLKNLGLEMLTNIASEFVIRDFQSDKFATTLMRVVMKGLNSPDRVWCLSSLEVLNKISQNERNEDTLLRSLEAAVYESVCSFLTIHDVMLLIYTLECLYSLSSLGERSCNLIVNNHGVVDTLVSLVTVEGKSYGPKSCIGMKLVETVSGVTSSASLSASSISTSVSNSVGTSSSTSVTIASSLTTTPNRTTTTLAKVSSSLAAKNSSPNVTVSKAITSTPVRTIQMAPQRLLAVSSSPSISSGTSTTTLSSASSSSSNTLQALTPQQLIQQQHAHQQAIHENEQFALAWLRATYEPCGNSRVNSQELYKHYINSCTKIGRRGVISPLHFPRCVRSVFGGTVGPNPMKQSNPNEPQYYDGIKVMAHPHLSQALLGTSTSSTLTSTNMTSASINTTKESSQIHSGQTNTSLIKSLLANKVNDCMTPVSMKTAASDCQNVVQVAERQRLLAQQQTPVIISKPLTKQESFSALKINGARQLFTDEELADPSVSSTTPFANSSKSKKEPPQPPPPPLAPLSNQHRTKNSRIDNEDSDSIGNNSIASSTGLGTLGVGGISSTEDGDNSLTSFEGLLNGIPNLEHPLNEDSNSKDSINLPSSGGVEILKNKPLRLADLLEKRIDKPPLLLNGSLGKELKFSDKGLDLVENHIEKALHRDVNVTDDKSKVGFKRIASEDIVESEAKKCMISLPTNVNGNIPASSATDSLASESVSSSNGDTESAVSRVSTAAAKLFADMAADILEDEDEEQLLQEVQSIPAATSGSTSAILGLGNTIPAAMPQIMVDNNQMLLAAAAQSRQIIVSQSQQLQQGTQVMIQAGTQIKGSPQTVIVQSSGQQMKQMVLQQTNTGQILLSQGLQGQVQLVASANQPGQYVLQTSGSGTYMVAQQQTAVVHGQPQTVLVAQTAQQQGTGAKTIIILQQQAPANTSHHQKVVTTLQGQQVVVTQVPRPVLHNTSISNIIPTSSTTVIKTTANLGAAVTAKTTQSTTTSCSVVNSNNLGQVIEKKLVEIKPQVDVKPQLRNVRIIRDLSTPFVCEWGECAITRKFKSANEVYMHVCEAHCPRGSEEIMCQWDRCDNMKRKRFSLMTHVYDKHCNSEALKQGFIKRKQGTPHVSKADPPAPPAVSPHPGYAPDAALHAIKRHALEFVNPKELQDDNEGPVTKSIRLTASLILRNLVIYSSNCRRYLKHYEPHLANVALSNVESSRTIAQVLYDMNQGSNHR